jgi:hypothetical protein
MCFPYSTDRKFSYAKKFFQNFRGFEPVNPPLKYGPAYKVPIALREFYIAKSNCNCN